MMRTIIRSVLPAALAILLPSLAAPPARAELNLPRPSPKATVTQTVGLTDFTVTYCRPGVKERVIWGSLVPYNEPWRTGANEATSFLMTGEATIGGKKLPAGEYSLYTLPAENEWTVILSTEKGAWGSFTHDKAKESHRFAVKPAAAPHVERMRFSFENMTDSSTDLVLNWEKLQLVIPIEVETHAQAMAGIRTAMAEVKADDWRTPFRCAQYCFNAGDNLDEAMKWAEQSVAAQAGYLNLGLLADMKMKAGKREDAIAAAERALKAGREDPSKPDMRPLERKLSEWKGSKG